MKKNLLAVSLVAVLFSALSSHAQNFYYKTNNASALNLPASWTTNGAPTATNGTPTFSDWAVWNNIIIAAANCTNSLGASTNWGGIQILNPPAPVAITGSGTLSLGTPGGSGLGIDMSQATEDLSIDVPLITVATQTWSIASGHFLNLNPGTANPFEIGGTVGGDLSINGGGTVNAYLLKDFRVGGGCNLFLTNSSAVVPIDMSQAPSGSPVASLSVGYAGEGISGSVTGTVVQTTGVVRLCKNSTSTGCLLLGANGGTPATTGIYYLNGGSLIDTNSTKADYFSIGDGAADTGILAVNGGSVYVAQIQIGNSGYGYVNVTNGTITTGTINETPTVTEGGALLINKGGSSLAGYLNVVGGTITIINNSLTVGNRGSASGLGGFLTLSGTGVINVGANVNIPNTATSSGAQAPGMATINGGLLNVSNNIVMGGANFGLANVSGTLNLNGGTVIANGVATAVSTPQCFGVINFNGATLRARANNGNFINNLAGTTVCVSNYVQAGGAIIDDGGFAITVNSPFVNGTGGPDGGLTKLDTGSLTLTADNTYNGPTIVGGGTLSVATTNLAGGVILPGGATIDVTNGTLNTTLTTNGTTLVCSNLAFGGSGGVVSAQFNAGTNSNPAIPFINVTNNLTAVGTVTVNILGSGFTAGVVPLIQYSGSISGGGSFVLGVVQGFAGFVTNNTTAQQIQLVITGVSVLDWRALVNTNWDLATLNWYDLSNNVPASFGNGATIFFDDSTSNSFVNIATTVLPGTMTLNNNASNYVFRGTGNISGITGISKLGSGFVTMGISNSYNGATVISNGVFTLGTNNAIPAASDAIDEGKLDMAGYNTSIHSLNGNNGVVDNSGATASILTIGGNGGTFSGLVTNSGASLALSKGGGNFYLQGAVNYYSGGTTNGGGLLQLGDAQSIGTGPLALNGGTLAWANALPQTVTNPVTMTGTVTFGTATNGNGLLTITRTVNFVGSSHGVDCYQDVLWANGMTNGSLTSLGGSGTNTLTLLNSVSTWTGGSFSLGNGTLVLNNSTVTQELNNIRIQCGTPGGMSLMIITNGSTLVMADNAGSSDFRFGDTASGGSGCTNELDLYGTLTLLAYPGPDDALQMGSTTDQSENNILNLMPGGLLDVRLVRDLSPEANAVFNFDGGTLMPSTNDFASTFMQGLTTANVLGGGAVINTAGYSITIAQPLINDGVDQDGGLTKLGLGTLYLNGASTYTNTTLVSAGALGGTGILASPVLVQSGASLMAGSSTTNIGTFTVNSAVTLAAGSSAVMKIDKLSGVTSSDNIAATKLTYSGTLVVVTNFDMNTALAIGDTFTLFTAGTYSGSFTSYNLPALPLGMGWSTSQLGVNGSISIVSVLVTSPVFSSVSLSGTKLVLGGTNGVAGNPYYVLTSTNLTLPLAQWTVIATNSFDSFGNFSFTNAVNPTNPAQFFDISVQ